MLIRIIPLLYFAEIFSTSMLFSNLTVLELFPIVNSEAITSASSAPSISLQSINSSTNGLNIAVITISLSLASMSISFLSRPGTAAF